MTHLLYPLLYLCQIYIATANPCVPQDGLSYLVIGQDYDSISHYINYAPRNPSGFMSYISLFNLTNSSRGLLNPIDYGSGIEWVFGLRNLIDQPVLQIGLYLVDTYLDVVKGVHDSDIETLGIFLTQLNTSVFLRVGYEFNSPENHYESAPYILAYQYIVDKINTLNPTNIAYVWHASGFQSRDSMQLSDWFPGSKYVDWCGLSLFQQPYDCITNSSNDSILNCSMIYAANVAEFCSAYNKPVMIAESTPIGGIVDLGLCLYQCLCHLPF